MGVSRSDRRVIALFLLIGAVWLTARVAVGQSASPGSTEGMIRISGGAYPIGSDQGREDERPTHQVMLEPFWIDRYEVTNAQFTTFLESALAGRDVRLLGDAAPGTADARVIPGADAVLLMENTRAAWARFGETHAYAFSMFIPADFPIVDVRLVTSQWKQTCNDCAQSRSPIVARRYRKGELRITIETPRGRQTIFRRAGALQGRWLDLRYRIRFHLTDGVVTAWLDGVQVVDYRGPLGFADDPPDVYFRLGLYRNRMAQPMALYFDDFRTERLAE